MVCFLPAPQPPAEHPRHAGLLRGPSARPAPPGSLSGLRESSRGCPTRRRCHTRGTWHGTGVETAAALRDGARSSRPAAGARPALSQAPGSGVAMAGICKRKGRRAWHGGGVRHRSSTKAMPGAHCSGRQRRGGPGPGAAGDEGFRSARGQPGDPWPQGLRPCRRQL